ncbi:armadillo-type protein [Fimicolochytrium jonesii]|uniref:armadillo-type protein n=1 Tax=Fimicolochytrium jonesii TaxID=1396493 RepID=UPI0022FDD6E4|nr:armadillo-type protein [Fimicolochytrium jonesii]KAI8823010.1 armadillo-type protein [Fimicolochytrium jonesii]
MASSVSPSASPPRRGRSPEGSAKSERGSKSPSRSPSASPGPRPSSRSPSPESESNSQATHEDQDGARVPLAAVTNTNGSAGQVKESRITKPDNIIGRAGGAYIPPARLRAMQAAITDKSSPEYQRMTWEALKKSLNGLINKVNTANIKNIVVELFGENLVRGRGLLCRSIMKAQAASLPFTPVYAALIAVINTKFPQIGELLLTRLVQQFRRAYKRSDKAVCLANAKFLAHLVNQKVAHEIVALQLLTLLLERPTDDSVEVAVGFMRDCGAYLTDVSPKACNGVFDRFRAILHESTIDKRTQYMVEVLFQVRKDKFKDNLAVPEELDLVDEDDQMTHMVGLSDEDLNVEEGLNVFKFDTNYLGSEEIYQQMKKEILGEGSDDESDDDGSEEESGEESEEESEAIQKAQERLQIQDETNTNLINLRRAIYLTIMSSLNFEECAHKLMRLKIQPGQESELVNMITECCGQERTYVNFYGLLGERFCRINKGWSDAFCASFEETYKTIHRYETNRLRNIAKFFAHLLSSDALTWEVFALVRLTEADTTSSSRIFIKILFQDLVEAFGLKNLDNRLRDPSMIVQVNTPGGYVTRGVFEGLFPKDNPRNTRFAINYFTSIGLGGLTEDLREFLKNAPKLIMAQQQEVESDSDSSTSSDSDSDSSERNGKRYRSPSRSPSRDRRDSKYQRR